MTREPHARPPRSEWEAWEAERRTREAYRMAGCMALVAIASLLALAFTLLLVINDAI